ncbi:hypothetical protein P692DRAFT_201869767 [Suillus brevipes Sb2]|nr:hypothetical protein P692DRAFT_201869767 [Suillus brevipes Sb2]
MQKKKDCHAALAWVVVKAHQGTIHTAPVSSMGMAEMNDTKAATMIAEEKRIVCDSCDIESVVEDGFYVLDIVNVRLAWLGLQTDRLCNTSRLPERSVV